MANVLTPYQLNVILWPCCIVDNKVHQHRKISNREDDNFCCSFLKDSMHNIVNAKDWKKKLSPKNNLQK